MPFLFYFSHFPQITRQCVTSFKHPSYCCMISDSTSKSYRVLSQVKHSGNSFPPGVLKVALTSKVLNLSNLTNLHLSAEKKIFHFSLNGQPAHKRDKRCH